MNAIKILVTLATGLSVVLAAHAQESFRPLTFQGWKDQQILEAQNQVLRASLHVKQLKAGTKARAVPPTELPGGGGLKKIAEGGETLTAAEQDLKRAQDINAEAAQLKFENYVEAYVSTLAPELVQKLSERLTKEELTEIVKYLMARPRAALGAPDAKRNAMVIGGLTVHKSSVR